MINLNTTTPDNKASMHEVVMKKEELLKALIENKAKHDAIFATAVSGYWELAKEKLDVKKAKLQAALDECKQDVEYELSKYYKLVEKKEVLPYSVSYKGFRWDNNLNLVYPENHTQDYERAIRMMRASVYDEVRLSEQEFDSYVLNNWEWKKNFLASNTAYVDTIRGRYGALGVKGATGPMGSAGVMMTTGCYIPNYDGISDGLAISGCAMF